MIVLATMLLPLGCESMKDRDLPLDPKPSGYTELELQAAREEPGTLLGNVRAATSPRRAYELYRSAVKKRDFDACWRLLSRATQDTYERGAANVRMRVKGSPEPLRRDLDLLHVLGLTRKEVDKLTGRMMMESTFRRADYRDPEEYERITRTDFDHETIWGDRATVYFKDRATRRKEHMRLIREGGVWRIEAATVVKSLSQ